MKRLLIIDDSQTIFNALKNRADAGHRFDCVYAGSYQKARELPTGYDITNKGEGAEITEEMLYKCADDALYRAKDGGRNAIVDVVL